MTSDLAAGLGMKEPRGVVINSVNPGGPADKAGVKAGDVILQLDGQNVKDPKELRNRVAAKAPGTEVTVTILREGKEQQLRVRLGTLTPETGQSLEEEQGGGGEGSARLGITVVPITPEIASELGLRRGTQGVVIRSVDPDGPAAQAGLRAGDVIQEVNRQPVRSPDDLRSTLQRSGNRPPLLLINRGGQSVFVAVPLG
jgi:S1-C subfamily serine protease